MAIKIKVGIIGCGAIGSEIAAACQKRLKAKIDLVAVCDADTKKAETLAAALGKGVEALTMDALIKKADLVIEAASAAISANVAEKCIREKKDCMVMSVGGLLGREKLLESAKDKGIRLYIPSGAICGLDGLKAASIGKIASVTLTTRKPPKGLAGAPYLKEKNIDVAGIDRETVVFEGSALEAVKGFPQNINVAAVLSLAGIGAERTRVRIVTSPAYSANIHEVEITGECGVIRTRAENVPSPNNPKTSYLAIMSAIALLEGITSGIRIGT